MKKLTIDKILGLLMLVFAIGFNLYLYRLEPTATTDPNDNTFQFALVDRTNTVWDFAVKKCSSSILGILTYPVCHFSYLADHWVNNWAEGYNLPYYYSHIPQIAIVSSWRVLSLITDTVSLFQYYHIVIYLLLCFTPLPVFIALRVMQLPWLTAGIGALLATHLSTDGLYGLDPSSYLWRGYGLSSQLFAMLWLPMALAYSFRYFTQNPKTQEPNLKQQAPHNSQKSNTFALRMMSLFEYWDLRFGISSAIPAILFVTLTTAGHLGIGMITMLSIGFLAIATPLQKFMTQHPVSSVLQSLRDALIKLMCVAGIPIFLLSYWIIPTFIHGNFHNMSFWDPVWKFDSYGAMETIIRLFNGDLLDFGRLPVLTALTFAGIMAGFGLTLKSEGKRTESENEQTDTVHKALFPFSYLFIFWIVFYFGRTTWGGIIDLIPGMKDFHLSRFIVGVHVAAMLLVPIGFSWTVASVWRYASRYIKPPMGYMLVYITLGALIIPTAYKWTLTYNDLNDRLIVQANGNHAKVREDEQALFSKLRSLPPARIFAGRGGGFGKRFEVAETPYYMHLSTYGLPTTLWLPETWSMNSDTEQYFSEDQEKDYDLYNIRYVAAPADEPARPFWTLIDERPTWKLYEVKTTGYFTTGIRPATVSIGKQSFMSLVHLWIQSDMHKNRLFPEMTFDASFPKTYGLPNFKMLDEVTYITPDGKKHNIWSEPPVYLPTGATSMEEFNKILSDGRSDDDSEETLPYVDMELLGPEKTDTDMIFSTTVRVGKNCRECLVILKHTFHPGWKAYIDGIPAKTMIVFPFYIGVQVPEGTHAITLSYEPSKLKVALLTLAIVAVAWCIWLARQYALKKYKPA